MAKNKSTRQNIPYFVKWQLWAKAAGRCEFNECNKLVWINDLTLREGNFAEVAHIIAAKKDGPRGADESEELQIDISNLMLVCQRCHKEIDDDKDGTLYTIELLRKWKQEHEDRIEIQTEHPYQIGRSMILMCSINIGDRYTPINIVATRNAIFPKYPIDLKGIKIDEQEFDNQGEPQYWQYFAETKIKRKIQLCLTEGIDDKQIKHISIFGIAPIPLLVYLGKCIGDTIPSDIYNSHRNLEHTNQTWSWQEIEKPDTNYIVSCEKENNSKTVFLKLAISDTIAFDKYKNIAADLVDYTIYQITVAEPTAHFLKTKKQLEIFSHEYRKLLNVIQANHGIDCKIYLLPAIPVAIAIECGRVLLPTKDPEMWVYGYDNKKGFTQPVLQIF